MRSEKQMNHSTTSRISGYVTSVEGAMLSGATVACCGTETKTLADGFFVLDGLDLGSYDIRVSLQGFTPTSKAISVGKGEEVTLDFCLSKSIGTAKIHGRVYDAESKEVVENRGSVILILPVANRYKHIDSNGHYGFDNLPAGTYKILTSIPRYEGRSATVTATEGEIETYDFLCRPIEVEEPPWG